MNISYISVFDASDIKSGSGTDYYIPKAMIAQSASLTYISNLERKNKYFHKGKEWFYRKFLSEKYLIDRSPTVLRGYAEQIKKRAEGIKTDVFLSYSSIPVTYLDAGAPVIFWADANFADMIDYYPYFTGLSEETIRNGNLMEKQSINNAAYAVYSSEWARQGAIKHYGADPEKVKVIPYGANIDNDYSVEDIKNLVNSKSKDVCKLLFIGVEWYRKGGKRAVEIVKYLNDNGVKAELAIVGVTPDDGEELPDYVKVYGFISKKTPEGKKLLEDLISGSHFLVLPTLADCTPIVYCEFSSFGIPSITNDTGGVSSVVADNVNGKLFPVDSPAEQYGEYIISMFTDHEKYMDMALSSFNEYKTRLNWDYAGRKMKELIETLM